MLEQGSQAHRQITRAAGRRTNHFRGSRVPILFLTALGDNQDVVEGLRAGGDDYLSKPYDLEVFVARVEARLREKSDNRRYVIYGCLRLDTVSLAGYVNG